MTDNNTGFSPHDPNNPPITNNPPPQHISNTGNPAQLQTGIQSQTGMTMQNNANMSITNAATTPQYNTLYMKKAFNVDNVSLLKGISNKDGVWKGITFEAWTGKLMDNFISNDINEFEAWTGKLMD